jgi:hypothetical protein
MNARTLAIAMAISAASASACATASDTMVIRSTRAEVERFAGEPVESVSRRPMRSNERWEAIGDYGLLIWESRKRVWLVDFERGEPACEDLSREYQMHMDTGVHWLDSRSGSLELHNGRWCEIEKIRPVDGVALRKARLAQGISSPY